MKQKKEEKIKMKGDKESTARIAKESERQNKGKESRLNASLWRKKYCKAKTKKRRQNGATRDIQVKQKWMRKVNQKDGLRRLILMKNVEETNEREKKQDIQKKKEKILKKEHRSIWSGERTKRRKGKRIQKRKKKKGEAKR